MPIPAPTSGTTRRHPERSGTTTPFSDLILADLSIDGTKRQVLMQANKNGFFYVLDRKTGQLISAKNFTPVTWASGIDLKTGRPIENPGIRYDQDRQSRFRMLPGALGAHSWQSMAFNPKTGLGLHPGARSRDGLRGLPPKDFKLIPVVAGTSESVHEYARRQGLSARLGSGEPEGSLARQLPRTMERRRADHRRQPRDAGKRRRLISAPTAQITARSSGRRPPSPP